MPLIPNVTEEEFIDIVNTQAKQLYYKFKFGYHSLEDIQQECYIYAIESLDKYDHKRPLPNYLYICLRNKLYNLKRNKLFRPEKPCDNCPFNAYIKESGTCSKFEIMMDCELYNLWYQNNHAKKNLMEPVSIGGVLDENESHMSHNIDIAGQVSHQEIIKIIDQYIPINLRRIWLKARNEIRLTQPEREKLQEAINIILEDHGIEQIENW